MERDAQLSELQKKADQLFEKHQFQEAQPIFVTLAKEFPNDYFMQLKAGLCLTVFGDNVKEAEPYISKCISLHPLLIHGYSLYATNFVKQQRYGEALKMAESALDVPASISYENDLDTIKSVLNAAGTSLIQLGQPDKLQPLVNKAKDKYPNLSAQIDTIVMSVPLESLWKKGHEWIQAPHKDFTEGLTLFTQILSISPEDYWATLLIGGCYTWSPPPLKNLSLGETYIKKAIQILPGRANAYTLLAQCTLLQGKKQEVLQIVNEILLTNFPGIESDKDQLEKIVEAVDCARQASSNIDPNYQSLLILAKSKYPQLNSQLSNLNDKNNCLIM